MSEGTLDIKITTLFPNGITRARYFCSDRIARDELTKSINYKTNAAHFVNNICVSNGPLSVAHCQRVVKEMEEKSNSS